MPKFNEFIKGFEEAEQPKSQRDIDTAEHNKIIGEINARAPKMKHEDYKKEIDHEVARFNAVQDKWEDETPKQEAPKAEPKANGYYKDEKGEIYMMKDGQDYYPVGEKERSDFFTAFNKQNKAQEQDLEAPAPQPKQGSFQEVFGEQKEEKPQENEYKPKKDYGIYGEILEGDERKHMADLAKAFNEAGLDTVMDDYWQDYGAGIEWTSLVSDNVQTLTPREWGDYMSGRISAQELVEKKKNDPFWGKRFKEKPQVVENDDAEIYDYLEKHGISRNSPIAQGLTEENKKLLRELLKGQGE